jgi:hypothetical protein
MKRRLFQPGGALGIRDLGSDRYRMNITIPKDADGRIARECPNTQCSPAYFKVTPGTGITGGQVVAYCPYCRHEAEPNDFATREQVRYAKDLAVREAHKGIEGVVKDALGLGASGKRSFGGGLVSMTMTYKPGTLPTVRRPFEDEVRRDVVCPHCTLDHTVFGLATWCADCGTDIFLRHVRAELDVTRSMVGDIGRRREALGRRVAAKDLENCLEDAVSIFEAAMKAMTRRLLTAAGATADEAEARLKKIGNAFQNVTRTREVMAEALGIPALPEVVWDALNSAFEKRHPITHNLGVVDRKYLERAQSGDRHGRELRITTSEVEAMLGHVLNALAAVYARLFGAADTAAEDESAQLPGEPEPGHA